MSYLSGSFFVLTALLIIAYYSLPLKVRPMVLLTGSIIFYVFCGGWAFFTVLATALFSFAIGRILQDERTKIKAGKFILAFSIILLIFPWLMLKLPIDSYISRLFGSPIVVVGISFYTFEMISYLVDVYKGKVVASFNLLSFLNYSFYFPKLIQGPISRYKELSPQLDEGHIFDEKNFTEGFMEILWGFFLKLVIADKAMLLVNPVFDGYYTYGAPYAILGAVLYSIQLYTDFLGCVMILHGISLFFGIELKLNFNRPYMATSFKDFWQRWHISLSSWLSDYIYIPLGGSRKGKIRRFINLFVTFIVSAVWHGIGLTFMIWGLLHALYRIGETLLFEKRSNLRVFVKRILVFLLATLGWIFFRAENIGQALKVLLGCFSPFNISEIMQAGLIRESMGYKEFAILLFAIVVLLAKEILNEKGYSFKDRLCSRPFALRLIFYIFMIFFIINFGSYGYGYSAADFIYGGF